MKHNILFLGMVMVVKTMRKRKRVYGPKKMWKTFKCIVAPIVLLDQKKISNVKNVKVMSKKHILNQKCPIKSKGKENHLNIFNPMMIMANMLIMVIMVRKYY